MIRHRRRLALLFVAPLTALLAGTGVLPAPASAATARSSSAADRAVAFIASQQNPDGGFGDGPTSETPDAVLAIADAAQTDLVFDTRAARAAVHAVGRSGNDALDYLDDLSEQDGLSAGKAAELVLVARAVGIEPRAFDPNGDGAVDLVATIDAKRTPSDFFYSDLIVILAHPLFPRAVTPSDIARIRAAQRSDGGWNYSGDQDPGAASDADVTGAAMQALVSGGVPGSDDALGRALEFLASQQNSDGGFRTAFGPESTPGSTRSAILGIVAAGHAVEHPCWRGGGSRYRSPDDYLLAQQQASGRIGEDTGFLATQSTSQSVQALVRNFLPVSRSAPEPCATTGYRLAAADGGVFAFAETAFAGSMGGQTLNRPIVATAATPSGKGYWLVASDGGVFSFGDAEFHGSLGSLVLNAPIVGAAATPSGGGYWLFASDGGVFAFGDAAFLGSLGAIVLNRPVVAGAPTPSGEGYWLLASDGGVFTFGDAPFAGSKADTVLNRPIVGGDGSRTGRGYWLFASDGGVFALGDAAFAGSLGGEKLNAPIVAGVRSMGNGYYLTASDGGVFAFGDAPWLGSEGARTLNAPVVGMHR